MKKGIRRFLAGLCTSMMLSQAIWDSGFAVYAAAGNEAVAYEEEAGTVSDEEAASENDAAEEETAAAETASENDAEAAADDEAKAEAEDQKEEDVEIPGEEINYGEFTIGSDGTVYVAHGEKSERYGTFKNGVFTLAKEVEHVYSDVFPGWEDVTKINFEAGSETVAIWGLAFRECKNLKEIDFSNAAHLTTIEFDAFSGCEKLEKITFHEKLQYIESNAFSDCVSLNSVTLKKELVSLGSGAFSGCTNLEKVRIESTNLSLNGNDYFKGCNIKEFELESENPKKNEIVPANLFYGAGFAPDAVIKIQKNVKEIGENAFRDSNINYVELPNELTTISNGAFSGCHDLKEINLNKVQRIGDEAFRECGFTVLAIPDTVIRIGDSAFYGSKVSELTLGQGTNSVESLGASIFENCDGLISVSIPSPNTYVGEREFKHCTNLRNVVFSDTVTRIGAGAFQECFSLTKITLPKNTGFKEVPDDCFNQCVNLVHVLKDDGTDGFREGITTIGSSAFYNCQKLVSNIFPSTLEYIGDETFRLCQSFVDLVIPAKVEHIGNGAFAECIFIDVVTIQTKVLTECGYAIFYLDYLKEIHFPEGVNTIPANLFNQATWVTDRNIVIPNTVEIIGEGAFRGGDDEKTSNFLNITFEKNAEGGYNIKYIGDSAFQRSRAISGFTIPDSVTHIGNSAFAECAKLEEITIPENVTYLGGSAFADCSILADITYNAIAVESANSDIFARCNVKHINIGPKVRLFPDNLFRGAQFAQAAPDGTLPMVTINVPASCERIGNWALPNINNLEKVVFEEGSQLKEIGEYGLQECINLTECALPATVTSIGTGAFKGDVKLQQFDLPAGLELLGAEAFWDCKKFTEVTLGNKLKEIYNETFKNCIALTKVTFAEGSAIERIGDRAFEGCAALTPFVIPASVRGIGDRAFVGCSKFDSVTFGGDSVLESIYDSAFENSPIAGELKLPETLYSIGSRTFYTTGKTGVTDVYLYENIYGIGEEAFNIAYKDNLRFHVVAGTYAEEWLTDNGFIITETTANGESIIIEFDLMGHGDNFERSVKEGNKLAKPADPTAEGYMFGGWYTDKSFKNEYNFDDIVTKKFTLYAKWSKEAQEIKGGQSALDPVPEIKADTTELWLVKGQKFNIGEGWYAKDKNSKKYVSVNKKTGAFKAKKVTVDDTVKICHDGREDIIIHISQPSLSTKNLTFTFTAPGEALSTQDISLFKDEHIKDVYWCSSAPDVATVDQTGKVSANAKGSAKISAYVNGTAYTCTVKVTEKAAAKVRTMHINLGGKPKTISLKGVKAVWSSDNTEVATLDAKGKKVTAVKAGEATLTANSKGVDYQINLIVEDITLKGEESLTGGNKHKYTLNLKKGAETDIDFTSLDAEHTVVFKNSKPDIAFIDETGHVVARKAGKAKFTAKVNGQTITVEVKVEE